MFYSRSLYSEAKRRLIQLNVNPANSISSLQANASKQMRTAQTDQLYDATQERFRMSIRITLGRLLRHRCQHFGQKKTAAIITLQKMKNKNSGNECDWSW